MHDKISKTILLQKKHHEKLAFYTDVSPKPKLSQIYLRPEQVLTDTSTPHYVDKTLG